ncbi:MAG: tRNA (guanosine(46)-N7)-methyltransferase TrmB [Candidatus Gracilibacteria bacterium]
MPRKKLKRYEELKTFPNVLFEPKGIQGQWRERVFENHYPIILELGCGKGDYTLSLGKIYPDNSFIGMDIKGARLWKGAGNALQAELKNVRFLQGYIDHLLEYFGESEVDEIWITFPDPYPLKGDAKKRLTSPRFLERYVPILRPGGIVHLKTDDRDLYEYTKETLKDLGLEIVDNQEDIYEKGTPDGALAIQTYYEKKHLAVGRTISHIAWKMDNYPKQS